MDPASSSQAATSSPSLVIANTNHQSTLSMQLMTATGSPTSGGSTGATSNKPQTQPASRKVLSSDLSNYNLDHLYCHPNNDKKSQPPVPPASPFIRGSAATAAPGALPPTTDMCAVLKEIKQLKAMLLLHLDLIQEQSDQLASKDKLVLSLRKENDTLRLRITELTNTTMVPSPSATTAASASPVVITKSGRCSKPVLPVAVVKDDSSNKGQPTQHHPSSKHSAKALQAGHQQPTRADLLPKEEPLDATEQQQPPDAKSEIIKKFSSKLLANCSEKLNSLTATIETALTSNLTVSQQTRHSPTDTKTTRLTQDENVCAAIAMRSDSPTDTKPDISALLHSGQPANQPTNIIGERDGKLISKIILQRVQEDGEATAADLLTTFKVEDLGPDVREILNDYVSSVKTKQPPELAAPSKPAATQSERPMASEPAAVKQPARPSQASRRRRRRHDVLGIPKKRRRVNRTVEQANATSTKDTRDESAKNAPPKISDNNDEILAAPSPSASGSIPPPAPFIPPATRGDRSVYTGRRSFMTTKQMYATREWQMDEIADTVNHQIAEITEDERKSAAAADPDRVEDVNLEIPRWIERELTPLSSSETLEDISDEAFHRRHIRLELDEKKRKKWDIQRIREQRNVERLRRRLLKDEPAEAADGAEDVGTFYPPAENIKFVQITDDLPIQAFGEFIPVISAIEFGLPWQLPAARPAFAASPAGHLRSSDRLVPAASSSAASAAPGALAHTSIQFVKKKCVRRHYSTTYPGGSIQAPGGPTTSTAKSRSTKRSKR